MQQKTSLASLPKKYQSYTAKKNVHQDETNEHQFSWATARQQQYKKSNNGCSAYKWLGLRYQTSKQYILKKEFVCNKFCNKFLKVCLLLQK